MKAELRADGVVASENEVTVLMRADGLVARKRRRFIATTDSGHVGPISPNVLQRDFHAETPDTVWVTDVTFLATAQGWLYLAAMIDLFSRRVVGWSTSDCNDTHLALNALRDALRTRRTARGLVHRSDRGSPYASLRYRAELKRFGILNA